MVLKIGGAIMFDRIIKGLIFVSFLFFCILSYAERVSCTDFSCPVGQKPMYSRFTNSCICIGNVP